MPTQLLIQLHFLILLKLTDQGTQTETLLITEPNDQAHAHQNGRNKGSAANLTHSPSPPKELEHKLRKSASFSSSSGHSIGASSLGSSMSTTSLSYSPQRASMRTLKSDTINTFQKWETTIESVSYVTRKTVAISDYGSDTERPRSSSLSAHSQSTRSRSATPSATTPNPAPASSTPTDARLPNGPGLRVKQTAV